MLRREGAEPRVSVIFYQAVVQAVLLFGRIPGIHVGFLRKIKGHRAVRQEDGTCRTALIGEDDADCIEGVETFYYLRRILERSDDD